MAASVPSSGTAWGCRVLPPRPTIGSNTTTTLIDYINIDGISFSCLGLLLSTRPLLFFSQRGWNDLVWIWIRKLHSHCSKQNLIKIFTSIIWLNTSLKLAKAQCSARLLQNAPEQGRARNKGCSWEGEATCRGDAVKSVYNIY